MARPISCFCAKNGGNLPQHPKSVPWRAGFDCTPEPIYRPRQSLWTAGRPARRFCWPPRTWWERFPRRCKLENSYPAFSFSLLQLLIRWQTSSHASTFLRLRDIIGLPRVLCKAYAAPSSPLFSGSRRSYINMMYFSGSVNHFPKSHGPFHSFLPCLDDPCRKIGRVPRWLW